MQALSRKSIFIMCAAIALIVCALMLTACGKDSVPAEQQAPPEAAAAAAAPQTSSTTVETGGSGSFATETTAVLDHETEPTPNGTVECWAGDHKVISEDYYLPASMTAHSTQWADKGGSSTWTRLPCIFK